MSDVITITDHEVRTKEKRIVLVKPAHKVVRVVINKGPKGDKGDPGTNTDISDTTLTTIISNLFGGGIKIITGLQMDSLNTYMNSDLAQKLVVFYNGINRFLLPGTEWIYMTNLDGDVTGIRIVGGGPYTVNDVFVIFPNPSGP